MFFIILFWWTFTHWAVAHLPYSFLNGFFYLLLPVCIPSKNKNNYYLSNTKQSLREKKITKLMNVLFVLFGSLPLGPPKAAHHNTNECAKQTIEEETADQRGTSIAFLFFGTSAHASRMKCRPLPDIPCPSPQAHPSHNSSACRTKEWMMLWLEREVLCGGCEV